MVTKKEINGVTIKFTDESKALPSVVAVSTVKIAKIFGKEHKNVLRDFRKAIDELGKLSTEPSSKVPLWADIEYENKQGKMQPAMAVSERLFYQVILAYKGKEAFALRKIFIDTFFDMRLQLMEATVAFQNRSFGQRDRRRKELKESHKEELESLQDKIDDKNALIAQCLASLQDDVD